MLLMNSDSPPAIVVDDSKYNDMFAESTTCTLG